MYEQASKPSPKIYTHIKNVGILLQGHACTSLLKVYVLIANSLSAFFSFYSFLDFELLTLSFSKTVNFH